MSLRSDCRKCGMLFDAQNTGYKDNGHGHISRYCKNCNRHSGCHRKDSVAAPIIDGLGRRGRPRTLPLRAPQPVFFTHTRRVETCECEPWTGRACPDCAARWALCVAENEAQGAS